MILNFIANEMIKIERLADYFPENFEWNKDEVVKIDDITEAIKNGQLEEEKEFDPNIPMPYEWHIRRIIYFINHPEEIKYINIGNVNDGDFVLPTPIIIDGYHRFLAAMWLYSHDKIKEIYCLYNGRSDILDYLNGKTNKMPSKCIKKIENESMNILNCCISNNNDEYYMGFVDGEDRPLLTVDIRRAKKLSETSAKNLIEMFSIMFPNNEYKIVTEDIDCKYII